MKKDDYKEIVFVPLIAFRVALLKLILEKIVWNFIRNRRKNEHR